MVLAGHRSTKTTELYSHPRFDFHMKKFYEGAKNRRKTKPQASDHAGPGMDGDAGGPRLMIDATMEVSKLRLQNRLLEVENREL